MQPENSPMQLFKAFFFILKVVGQKTCQYHTIVPFQWATRASTGLEQTTWSLRVSSCGATSPHCPSMTLCGSAANPTEGAMKTAFRSTQTPTSTSHGVIGWMTPDARVKSLSCVRLTFEHTRTHTQTCAHTHTHTHTHTLSPKKTKKQTKTCPTLWGCKVFVWYRIAQQSSHSFERVWNSRSGLFVWCGLCGVLQEWLFTLHAAFT